MTIAEFQKTVWAYYYSHKRAMPWRQNPTPYYVLVSEMMLQQTQVPRVVPKFERFINRFPTMAELAAAPLGDVLAQWSGLGYNRRAKYLWQAAKKVVGEYGGVLPRDTKALTDLPGIGPNTAGAIQAYAFGISAVFIETNIRTVFIQHFFANEAAQVSDAAIRELVAETLPAKDIREWYWALMDYGTYLKANVGASLHRVRGYKPQSRFAGSLRQVRGQVLKALVDGGLSQAQLAELVADARLPQVLAALLAEELIHKQADRYTI